jgi:hypothetical protein
VSTRSVIARPTPRGRLPRHLLPLRRLPRPPRPGPVRGGHRPLRRRHRRRLHLSDRPASRRLVGPARRLHHPTRLPAPHRPRRPAQPVLLPRRPPRPAPPAAGRPHRPRRLHRLRLRAGSRAAAGPHQPARRLAAGRRSSLDRHPRLGRHRPPTPSSCAASTDRSQRAPTASNPNQHPLGTRRRIASNQPCRGGEASLHLRVPRRSWRLLALRSSCAGTVQAGYGDHSEWSRYLLRRPGPAG